MIKTYIETTIPSFYHNNRSDPEAIAMERWTKKWWDHHSSEYHVVSSIAVINELRQGDHPRKCLNFRTPYEIFFNTKTAFTVALQS